MEEVVAVVQAMAHDACTLWQAAAEVSATHAAHTSTATAWVRKEFTDVLAAQLLPAQQEADPRSAAAMRMTCRAWACVARAVAWPFVRAHLWGAADMRSLASWLRTHPHVHRLHISTQVAWATWVQGIAEALVHLGPSAGVGHTGSLRLQKYTVTKLV